MAMQMAKAFVEKQHHFKYQSIRANLNVPSISKMLKIMIRSVSPLHTESGHAIYSPCSNLAGSQN